MKLTLLYVIPIIIILVLIYGYARYIKSKAIIFQKAEKIAIEHVLWTREFLLASFYETENLDDCTTRLMKNQEDIGSFIGSYYPVYKDSVTSLFKEHISIASQIDSQMKQNSSIDYLQNLQNVQNLQQKWNSNGDSISDGIRALLGVDISDHMKEHLKLTTSEIVSIQNGENSIDIYDDIEISIIDMFNQIAESICRNNIFTLVFSPVLPCCRQE